MSGSGYRKVAVEETAADSEAAVGASTTTYSPASRRARQRIARTDNGAGSAMSIPPHQRAP
ncbi:hypothetical protein ACQEVG_37160 [Streptomyces sp. CA-135486]|uniref:hypothetical protein n=1 Tax=Streptomyces sp. CA-135486 TaxID=3240049 RepID=UPI003D920252